MEKEIIKRFWSKINVRNKKQCWNWIYCLYPDSYGRFRLNNKLVYSHRLAYLLTFGEIPEGLCVLHKCDNPNCCNSNHLFLGTQSDNINDMTFKRRGRCNKLGNNSKLTIEQVNIIRKLYKNKKYNQNELANKFNVSASCINHIVNNYNWKKINKNL